MISSTSRVFGVAAKGLSQATVKAANHAAPALCTTAAPLLLNPVTAQARGFSAQSATDEDPEVKKARIEAEIKRWNAEGDKATLEVEAAKAKKEADERRQKEEVDAAAEAKRRQKAEADKAEAEAEKAATEAVLKKWKKYGLSYGLSGLAAICAFLMVDAFWRSCRWTQRQKIMAKMLWGSKALPPIPSGPLLPLAPLRNPLNDPRPLWLMGPSGTGKSTRASQSARSYDKDHVPYVYMRLRNADAGTGKPDDNRAASLTQMAERIYSSIGYSDSPCYVAQFFDSIKSLQIGGAGLELDKSTPSRLEEALQDAYLAASTLTRIRRWSFLGIPQEFQTSIIYADEFHDLRATALGQRVFAYFVKLGVTHGTEGEEVWTVALNSSGEVAEEEKDRYRLRFADQPNPDEQEARKKLAEKKYSAENIDKIIKVCGVRLRLLRPFFTATVDQVKAQHSFVNETLDEHQRAATAEVSTLMSRHATAEEFATMVTAMDELATGKGFLFNKAKIPEPYRTPFPKKVLSSDSAGRVFFQSEAVRLAWLQYKEEKAKEEAEKQEKAKVEAEKQEKAKEEAEKQKAWYKRLWNLAAWK